MAIQFEWRGSEAYWHYRGHITAEEMLSSYDNYYSDPLFDRAHGQLHNYLDLDQLNISQDDIKVMAALDYAASLSNPHIKVAFVASDETISTLTALYAHESEQQNPWEVQTFTSLDKAREWLATPH